MLCHYYYTTMLLLATCFSGFILEIRTCVITDSSSLKTMENARYLARLINAATKVKNAFSIFKFYTVRNCFWKLFFETPWSSAFKINSNEIFWISKPVKKWGLGWAYGASMKQHNKGTESMRLVPQVFMSVELLDYIQVSISMFYLCPILAWIWKIDFQPKPYL